MTDPQTQLALPKPNSRADRKRKKRDKEKSYQMFRKNVFKIANGRCENRHCMSTETGCLSGLSPHHIHKRSQGGPDTVANGILLCVQCHERAESGYNDHNGNRITARQYNIRLLEDWLGHDRFRWTLVLAYLKSKEPVE